MSHALVYAANLIYPAAVNLRHRVSEISLQPGFKSLTIIFSSGGGSTDEAMSLYDFFRYLPFVVRLHVAGRVASAAIPVMLAFDERTASPEANFLFHGYTWAYSGAVTLSTTEMEEHRLSQASGISWAKDVLKKRTKLTDADLQKLNLFDHPRIEGADFALAHGLIQKIDSGRLPQGTAVWNVGY